MTPTAILVSVGISLLLFLLLMTSREEVEQLAGNDSYDHAQRDRCHALQPTELAFRIFSREDREFITRMNSPRLQRIYQLERRRIALHWVRRTSGEVANIMRTHRLTSRKSHNLDAATEAKLFFQYLKLRLICEVLVLLIKIFGPYALSDLAIYAGTVHQLIGRALPAGAVADSAASARNPLTS